MIHYHGTPLTPRSELEKLKGRHFCVSFAHPQDAIWCLNNAQSVMWDNGAFSLYTKNKKIDYKKYYLWLEDKLGNPHWAIIPDVIGGSEEDNLKLLDEWPFPKKLGSVVWHTDKSFEYLDRLIDLDFGKICFGSSGEYWKVGSKEWKNRLDEAFSHLSKHKHLPWIHMLRGLSVGGKHWPFSSADSTNIARNFKNKGYEQCPEQMIKRIDSLQTPLRF